MATETLAPQPAAVTDVDRMPVHGIDHLELYVGNAAQTPSSSPAPSASPRTAYSGLETGRRDRVSHVLEQGRIRLVVTGTLMSDGEIGEHHKRHGDGVHKVALSVPDEAYTAGRRARGARGDDTGPRTSTAASASPRSPPTATPSASSSSATASTVPSCPDSPRETGRPPARLSWRASTTWWATWSSATWRSGWPTTSACSA